MQFDKTQPLYIIGDVHGCYKTLCALIEKLPQKWDSQIIFVGDLIDRGKESCEVIDLVIKNNYACILGNHEELMLEYYHALPSNPMRSASVWICNGGHETMQSYQNNGGYQKIHEHLDYLSTLPRFLEIDYPDENGLRLFVTHGFGLPLYRERNE
ncbi:MAG: metallophosphoesterase, partial [Helicobacter sp.]|nr:metallophosphoesterase [Helicobacter sp.]